MLGALNRVDTLRSVVILACMTDVAFKDVIIKDLNWEADLPNLYLKYAEPYETLDGVVIAFEDPVIGGFHAKDYDGSFVYEKQIEDLYIKDDVALFSCVAEAENEFVYQI